MTILKATNASLTIQTQEQDMLKALDKLKAVAISNDHPVTIQFEIEYEPISGFTVPTYWAVTGCLYSVFAEGKTPMQAVRNLFKKMGITRVEQYIRIKENQQ